jgi:hypothetical protein
MRGRLVGIVSVVRNLAMFKAKGLRVDDVGKNSARQGPKVEWPGPAI